MEHQAGQVVQYPDMVLQFAHHVAETFRSRGYEEVEVRAIVVSSLHGRDYQHLVDPSVDLAEQPRTPAQASWIVQLEEPLPPPS